MLISHTAIRLQELIFDYFDEAYDIIYLYDTHAGKCTAAKNYLDNISVKLLKHVHSSFSDMNCIVLQITMQLYCIVL